MYYRKAGFSSNIIVSYAEAGNIGLLLIHKSGLVYI